MNEFQKLIKFLREQANALIGTNPESAKAWQEMATSLERVQVNNDVSAAVEETIAARIKNGDLVVKSAHEQAVATALKTGEDKVRKEAADKEAADKKLAETVASRIKAVTEAGLDPKFVIAKDQTIEQRAAAIPCTDEGNKAFEDRLEEWKTLSKKTGQAVASATASTKAPPIGGGSTDNKGKKPGHLFI